MRRTTAADLVGPFVVAGLAVYALLRLVYGSLPPLQYLVVVPVAALAVVEAVVARRVRAAVSHQQGARPMTAIAIARCAALAKASAVVAALVVGAAAGAIVFLLPRSGEVDAAAHDLHVAVVVVVASLLLLVAAVYLERCTLDPSRDERR